MYPSRSVDKVWEVATMLAHRDMHVNPASTSAATATAAAAARFSVNGTLSYIACCFPGLKPLGLCTA